MEVIAFGIRSDGDATGGGAGWSLLAAAQKSRASSSILFPSRGLVLVPFRFGSVLVAVPCFREASKEESLKFELTVILKIERT